jgi:hypothetical protein
MKLISVNRLSALCLTFLTLQNLFIVPALAKGFRFFGPAAAELLNSDAPDKEVRLIGAVVIVLVIIISLTLIALKRKRYSK